MGMKEQIENHIENGKEEEQKHSLLAEDMISTGSTVLDLEISGGLVRGGGLPPGIFVEVFGKEGTGKTVLLSEIAGNIQNRGGDVMFHDPESRLNDQFAKLFGLDTQSMDYRTPNTVTEVFSAVRKWEPTPEGKTHGVFTDSIAALSTDLEMDNEEGDKIGMRRAKELSQELRRTCRIIKDAGYLMVCSNQVRQNVDAGRYGQQEITPGGMAVRFYSSLRLKMSKGKTLHRKADVFDRPDERPEGVESHVQIVKSSVWKPTGTAILSIIWDYGIDDVKDNLQWIKTVTKDTTYKMGEVKLGRSVKAAIAAVEDDRLEDKLREYVIDLWEEIEKQYASTRRPKKRR